MPRQDADVRRRSRSFQITMTGACVLVGIVVFFASVISEGWPYETDPDWWRAAWRGFSGVMVTTGVVWAGARNDFRKKDLLTDVLRDWKRGVPFFFAVVGYGAFLVEILGFGRS